MSVAHRVIERTQQTNNTVASDRHKRETMINCNFLKELIDKKGSLTLDEIKQLIEIIDRKEQLREMALRAALVQEVLGSTYSEEDFKSIVRSSSFFIKLYGKNIDSTTNDPDQLFNRDNRLVNRDNMSFKLKGPIATLLFFLNDPLQNPELKNALETKVRNIVMGSEGSGVRSLEVSPTPAGTEGRRLRRVGMFAAIRSSFGSRPASPATIDSRGDTPAASPATRAASPASSTSSPETVAPCGDDALFVRRRASTFSRSQTGEITRKADESPNAHRPR